VQFTATFKRTWQKFTHFECMSSLCIVMCIDNMLITTCLGDLSYWLSGASSLEKGGLSQKGSFWYHFSA